MKIGLSPRTYGGRKALAGGGDARIVSTAAFSNCGRIPGVGMEIVITSDMPGLRLTGILRVAHISKEKSLRCPYLPYIDES